MFGLFIVIALSAGLTFNVLTIALPKIVDERLASDLPLLARRQHRDGGAGLRRAGATCGRPAGRMRFRRM